METNKFIWPTYGNANPEQMKKFKKLVARSEQRGLKKTIGSILFYPRFILNALFIPIDHFKFIKDRTGKKYYQQVLERLLLVLLFRHDPEIYTAYNLFYPERFRKAGEFISTKESINILPYFLTKVTTHSIDTVNDKLAFHQFCQKYNLPTPQVLYTYTQGDHSQDEKLISILQNNKALFFKPTNAMCGIGAGTITKNSYNIWTIRTSSHNSMNLDFNSLIQHLTETVEKLQQPLIIQALLANDPVFTFGTEALCTIRFISIKIKDQFIPFIAALRIADKADIIDNSPTNQRIFVDIDLESGKLLNGCFHKASAPTVQYLSNTPTNHIFTGITIPDWQNIKSMVSKLHKHLDEFPTLASDIAITKDGPLIMEANLVWAGMFQEPSNQGLGASDLIKCCLDYADQHNL